MTELLSKLLGGLNGDIEWLKDRTIYLTRHGSHAYGTNVATSDEDYRGVAIPPREYFIGFLKNFDNLVRNEPDVTIFDIRKFFLLAIDNNPNVLEILFVDPSDVLIITPLGEKLLEVREQFISRAAKERFLGYAKSQLHRIKSHKRWLMNPPEHPPTREEFGLPPEMTIPKDQLLAVESQLQKVIDTWRPDFEPFSEAQQIYLQTKVRRTLAEMNVTSDNEWMSAARKLSYSDNFIRLLQKEKEFQSKKKDWENYQKWQRERNEARAELEAQFGFDTKHGMHLIRLLRMAKEMLLFGKVIVKRPDAEELKSIRNGAWTYEQLIESAEQIEKEVEQAYFTSPLPPRSDRVSLDLWCQKMIESSF